MGTTCPAKHDLPPQFSISVCISDKVNLSVKETPNQHPPPKSPNTAYQFRSYSFIFPSTGPNLCKRLHV